MPNINNVIQKHSSKIIKNPASSTIKACDCRRKTEGNCPMDGNCLSEPLFTKHLLIQLLMNVTIVPVKHFQRTLQEV